MSLTIQNFNTLEGKVYQACVNARRDVQKELLVNVFPIRVQQWSHTVEKYTHVFYDAEFGEDSGLIKYLTPTALNIYVLPIIKAFERAGFQYKDDHMIIKAAEVLAVQKFYHMNCYNKANFMKHADYINGNLVMGDSDIEIFCFGLTTHYFRNKNDMKGCNIARLFNLLYDKETDRTFEPTISDSVLKDLRHKIVESFRPRPALV